MHLSSPSRNVRCVFIREALEKRHEEGKRVSLILHLQGTTYFYIQILEQTLGVDYFTCQVTSNQQGVSKIIAFVPNLFRLVGVYHFT